MPIAVEVAKVSGALRCGREFDCRRGKVFLSKKSAEPTLMELLDDTAAYAKRERKKILAELKRNKKRLKKARALISSP